MYQDHIDAEPYVAGELSLLIISYLDLQQLTAPSIRRRLQGFSRGSQMPIKLWWQILDDLHALNPDPNLGFEIGSHIQLFHSGVLGYLIAQNETVGDGLICFQRFQSLLHNYGPMNVRHDNERVHVDWDYQQKQSTLISDQLFVASLITVLSSITGTADVTVTELRFQQAAPKPNEAYSGLFNCQTVFGSPQMGMSFPKALLTLPIKTTDPILLEVINRQTHALIQHRSRHNDFLALVESSIVAALGSGESSAEVTAARLNISRRTLHRRLQNQGSNYHELLRDTRLKLAKMYLLQPFLSATDVAFLLGFSEQSAFCRAFKQWTGITPMQFRSQAPV